MEKVIKLEIPVRRSKGSQGDITVEWSLYGSDSLDSLDLIWPTSGKISMTDGQWNDTFILTVNNDGKEVPESVIWLQLENPTGGALLASRDETTAKIVIASNLRAHHSNKTLFAMIACVICAIVLLTISWGMYRVKKKTGR